MKQISKKISSLNNCYILFDQNILHRLSGTDPEHHLKSFYDDFIKYRFPEKAHYLVTPFIFLEAIGISPPPKIPAPSIPNNIEKNISKIREYLFEYAKKSYSEHPELSLEKLKEKAKNQLSYKTEIGKEIFKSSVLNPLRQSDFEKDIYSSLAFNFLYVYKFKKRLNPTLFDARAILDIFQAFYFNVNVSQYKAAYKTWLTLYAYAKKRQSFGKKFQNIHSSIKVKRFKDLVDTEIIHFATMGYLKSGILKPIICFTSDDAPKIIYRIAMYKTFINLGYNYLKNSRNIDLEKLHCKLLNPKPGFIIICDTKTSQMKGFIDVNKVPEIGRFEPWLKRLKYSLYFWFRKCIRQPINIPKV